MTAGLWLAAGLPLYYVLAVVLHGLFVLIGRA